ncbi:MAG: BON domain-containing protein [Verrucomicrobiota bacterium]|nr:BON domain-containing protein [Verrucomicrobiota bacterium]
MKSKYITTLLTAAAVIFISTVGNSLHATETDERIEESARNSYLFKTYLSGDTIKTESKNGVVTLTGIVADSAHRSLAADTVAGLPGVKSVDNKLEIKTAGPLEHSDEWIARRVQSVLLFQRSVSARGVQVSVLDGVVTLKGQAPDANQKEWATEYVQDIDGVKAVKNEMIVATGIVPKPVDIISEKIDDASITAQVKWLLLSHRSTSAINTIISTNDGIVTITGVAKNADEKMFVSKLVNDINGVSSVINNMTLETTNVSSN